MKRTVLIFAIAFLAAAALEVIAGTPENNASSKNKSIIGNLDNSTIFSIDNKKSTESIQAFSKNRNLAGITNWGPGTHFNSEMTPIIWEPYTNTLFISNNPYVYANNTASNIQCLFYKSSNMGLKWDTVMVFNEVGWGTLFPSITVANPTKSTNVNDLKIGMFSSIVNVPDFESQGSLVSYMNAKQEWEPEMIDAPNDNNPGNSYIWSNLRILPYSPNNTEAYFIGLGMLERKSTSARYGAYGVFSWDLLASKNQTITSSVLQKLGTDVFKESDDVNRSWNAPLNADLDSEGKLYILVNNIFKDDPNEKRVPAVVTSNDLGATWSDILRMPNSIIESFVATTGYAVGYPWDSYAMNAFIVTGPDEFSFVQKVAVGDAGSDPGTIRIRQMHLVEFYYRGGAWGFQQIAQVDINAPAVLFQSTDPDIKPTVADSAIYLLDDSRLANEIQLAKTADGSKIVLKWIDPSMNVLVTPPHVVSMINSTTDKQQLVTIDTFYTTDTYMCYRDAHQNNWSKTVNVTNDSTYDKVTWIPRIIPSITNIPMIRNWTPFFTAPKYLTVMNRRIAEAVVGTAQFIEFGIMDATKDAVGPAVSVEDNSIAVTDSKTLVTPNPAFNECELVFSVPQAGNVKIEVFNSLGQSAGVIFNSLQDSGVHVFSFDVSNYIPGAYYYTVTSGNRTETGKFNVVK